MMNSTLALKFQQKGAEETTRAVANLVLAVAKIQAAAATPIQLQVNGNVPSAGRGGGGGGGGAGSGEAGGGKGRAPRDPAVAAEAAAAKQAEAAAKVAAREEAASAKAERAAQKYIDKARIVNKMSAMRQADMDAEAKASGRAAQAVYMLGGAQRDAAAIANGFGDASKGAGLSLGGVVGAAGAAAAAITAVVAASIQGAQALMGLAAEGEKLKTISAAFEKLGGTAAEMEKLRDLTGGMVGDTDLQKAMNLARLFKLPAQEITQLIKVAQGAAVAMGETTGKMLSDTFTAASRQSKMIADNMGIVMGDLGVMYDQFARKIGKAGGDQLTDAEKTQAFVQKMVSEGGRQMELATLAQGNAAERAAVQWDNLSGNMMVAVADMMASMGVWDALGGAMQDLEGFVKGGIGDAGKYLAPLFQGLGDLLPPVVKAFGSLLPLVAPLGQAMSYMSATVEVLVPIIGGVATAVGFLASGIIDLLSMAIEPLLRAGAAVVGLLSDDMADAYTRAADAMANARVRIDVVNKGLEAQVPAVGEATAGWNALEVQLKRIPGTVDASDERLAKLGKNLKAYGATTGITTEKLEGMGQALAFWGEQAKGRGMEGAEAQKWAAEQLAKSWGVSAILMETAGREITATHAEITKTTAAQSAKATEDTLKDQRALVDSMKATYFDAAQIADGYGQVTNQIWEKAGGDEKKALDELDKWRSDHIAAATSVYAGDVEQYGMAVEQIARIHHAAMESMGLADTSALDDLMARSEKAGKSQAQLKKEAASAQLAADLAIAGNDAAAQAAAHKVYGARLKDSSGGGKGKRKDDLSPLLDRAARASMSARQLALADADKQFKADMEAAGKSAEGIAAAQGLYLKARTDAWVAAGKEQLGSMGAQGAALMEMGRQWLDDAAAVVEMTKAAEATMRAHRLGTEDVGVGDAAEGIKRRRTAREVEVVLEIEALHAEWEAKSAALQQGTAAYTAVLEEHQRKVADVAKEGMAEKAKADAEAMMNARFAFVAGFEGVFSSVQGEISDLIDSGNDAQSAFGMVGGMALAVGQELAASKQAFIDLQAAVNAGQISEAQAGVAGAGQLAAAAGRAASSVIKSEQGVAAAKALVEVGLAAASYAVGDFSGGIAHTVAAGLLFTAAGKGGGAAPARALTPRRSAAGSDRSSAAGDQRGPSKQEINIIINPITGQSVIGLVNGASQRQAGVQFNSRALPGGPRRPDL